MNQQHTSVPAASARDHRRLALSYAIVVGLALVIGAFLAFGLAIQPLSGSSAAGGAQGYQRLYSMHGLVMVFLVALPAVPAVLGNWLLPELLGLEELAWPRLNRLAFHLMLVACVLFLAALFAPIDTGWSFPVPFALDSRAPLSWSLFAILAAGTSYLCSSASVIATLIASRSGGRSWSELPLFAWALSIAALVQVIATPVLIGTLMLLYAQRSGATDALGASRPASDLRFDQWFWIWGHPAFSAMLVAALGLVDEILGSASGARRPASRSAVISLVAIAVLGFTGWGVHVLGRGDSPALEAASSALALASGVPFLVLLAGWMSALWQAPVRSSTALGYALVFLVLLCIGGTAGLVLGVLPTGVYLQGSAFSTAQFHYVVVGGGLAALLAGVYHLWPRWFGTTAREGAGTSACVLFFLGANLAFAPNFVLGYLGQPQRSTELVAGGQGLALVSAAGAALIACALVLAGWNLLASLLQERAPAAQGSSR